MHCCAGAGYNAISAWLIQLFSPLSQSMANQKHMCNYLKSTASAKIIISQKVILFLQMKTRAPAIKLTVVFIAGFAHLF